MAEKKQTAETLYQQVDAAAQALAQMQQQKPGAYTSSYSEQIDALAQQIAQRPGFAYDANGDPLYQQYSAKYQQQGRSAMEDTMGTAAGLTGGYGNSYATTASNQAYQSYLAKLDDVLPTLYEAAYGKYQDTGEAMQARLGNLQGLDNSAYSAYRDRVSDYESSVAKAQSYWQYLNDAAYKAQQDEQAQANWQANWDASHSSGGGGSGSSKKKKDVVQIAKNVSAASSAAAKKSGGGRASISKNTMAKMTQ